MKQVRKYKYLGCCVLLICTILTAIKMTIGKHQLGLTGHVKRLTDAKEIFKQVLDCEITEHHSGRDHTKNIRIKELN